MAKYNKKLIDQISAILTSWGKNIKAPKTENGMLDVDKLNELEETKFMIKELIELGVRDRKELNEMGFVAAGMILKF